MAELAGADQKAALDAAQAAATKQGDTVRSLKALQKDNKADKAEVDAAIAKLKELKASAQAKQEAYADVAGKAAGQSKEAFRAAMAETLQRRMFYVPSFKIYGAVAGFYDYGPPGCAVKQNLTALWRKHFVLEENMLEVECPSVTPEVVLKASGHVERFTDFMVTDVVTHDCHRADHLLEAALEARLADTKAPPSVEDHEALRNELATVEELDAAALGAALRRHGVKAPDTGNDISEPFPFNLMFRTSIGPKGDQVGYLRPETAQGIFVNFKDLLYYNGGRLPFAAAQIGQSYRNEIAPRAGLLRVREFTQAEIEHFCNPADKSHPKFASIAAVEPLLFSRELQMGAEKLPKPMSLGEAVDKGIIANQTLAYFIGRTYLFMVAAGVTPSRLRFRQHLVHEMAHYAEDCWDAEVECSYGWIECAGLADRSAYDLRAHSAKSGQDLTAYEKFPEMRTVDVMVVTPNKQLVGKTFKRDARAVQDALEALGEEDAACLQDQLKSGPAKLTAAEGQVFEVTPAMVDVSRVQRKLAGRNFTPSVIEPSFGVGRIIYCLLEHCYYTREGDEKRAVFGLVPLIAPIKASVFPLVNNPQLADAARALSAALTVGGLANVVDTTAVSIGRRYARTDELGVPFGLTVDRQTLDDGTVTLRERDSTSQVRVGSAEAPALLQRLTNMSLTWMEVQATFPAQQTADAAE
ncbi:hypothetical protein WJX81_000021 [Elliptochloris bilobata]|uniref:glycine--tRNA ligase n=1 Tax=Elliptochloris bilobata TaxID=381761 RepID=A0AAW1R358_9CHLO